MTSLVNTETIPASACVGPRGTSRYAKPLAKVDPRRSKATECVKEGIGTKSLDEILTSNSQEEDSETSHIYVCRFTQPLQRTPTGTQTPRITRQTVFSDVTPFTSTVTFIEYNIGQSNSGTVHV